MPLNALGLAGVTLLTWPPGDIAQLYPFFAAATMAYIATAVVRARLYGRGQGGTVERLVGGGQESAVAIASLLAVVAIFQRFYGLREDLALVIEAEFLVLAGVALGERYLRLLGGAVFVLPVFKLLLAEAHSGTRIPLPAGSVYDWTPLAVAIAAIFYLNRFLARREGSPYSYAASALLVVVLGAEVRLEDGWTAFAWLLFSVALWTAGRLAGGIDFERQSWGTASLAWLSMWFLNIFDGGQPGPHPLADRVALAAGAIVFLALAWQAAGWMRRVASVAGSALLAALLWKLLPFSMVAAAWALLAFALLLARQPLSAYLAAFFVFIRAWVVNFPEPDRVLTSVPVIALLIAGYLLSRRSSDPVGRPAFGMAAAGLLTVLLFYEVSGRMLTVAIGTEGASLLIAGFVLRDALPRWSGLALFLFCILKLFLYDLRSLDAPSRILSFVVLGLFLLAISWIYTRYREQIRRLTRGDYE